ncbi:DNA polymerase III, alpha subunit [Metamycoplasma auris 15026]|uniref:DNA-directed DNA polymerase n=1 Tax=Metamycoplasma auris 15026 TaxID=1188233 RepID=N9VCD1_9BACT|nr:DNA polymerase III subunit alpha [Metamycoplasma auris]ENY69343.1 DNA polymerase III, alpha subunit [Metamycoplasma auris 15026]
MKLLNVHLNTTYSFLSSTISVEDAIKKALESGVDYLVFSEKNHFFSLGEANEKCLKNNLKPIFGLDVFLEVDGSLYRYNLFAKNEDAFYFLKLISYFLLDNKKLTLDEILENYKDIIVIENPHLSYFKETKKIIKNSNYYIGLELEEINNFLDLIKNNENILVFNNFNILSLEDYSIIELLNKMTNKNQLDLGTPLFFDFNSKEEVITNLISKTNSLVQSLYFPILKRNYLLPNFENEKNLESHLYLKFLVLKKIKESNDLSLLFKNEVYVKRLEKELETISKLNFANYFLIVQDWVNWAKNNDIAIGPGRGSAAGSLVCFVLGITEIDSIKYDLIFERFLNAKRISMPDIDIDVQDDKRHLVINYLIEKYGYEKVNNIVTFSTLGKKSAIRDVLRAYEIAPSKINVISKLISSSETNLFDEFKKNIYLKKELEQLNVKDANFANKIVAETERISGFYRQIGTHAAGIVISSNPIIESIPISKNTDDFLQTQISLEYLEYFGLIKMDVLGLKTLTTIKEIENYVNNKNPNNKIDWNKINYFDKKTFELLSNGNTLGVFQVESPVMIKGLKEIGIDSFNDIAAVISLNRPGPIAYVSNYAKRKKGIEKIPSISNEYNKIVKDTYGIIIYQEQIMQIAQRIANMSFEEADLLRKIISKKQSSQMLQIKNEFINKAINNGYEKDIATEIFNNIEKFADYGFNKSHAIAYATLTFKMAYLKANYPLEFYASCISSANGAQATIAKYVNEAKSMGIEFISPHINKSFEIANIENNKIILPLGLIKGIGPEIIKLIIENRNAIGQYQNFLHCILNLSKIKSLGKATEELLIKAGTFRDFKLSQQTMLDELDPKSNLNIFIKENLSKSNEEILNKIANYQLLDTKQDNEEDLQANEIELLGQAYNYFITSKYEIDNNRLINTRINNEYVLVAQCVDVVEKLSKYKSKQQILYFQDSSYKVIAVQYKYNEELKNLKNKIVKIKFIRRKENWIDLIDFKVIK